MKNLNQRNANISRTEHSVEGGTMSAVHFGPINEPVKLVFLNANGFHGLAYRTILEPLGIHAVGLDLRGHGQTKLPTSSERDAFFHNYAHDVAQYLRNNIEERVVLAGHSLGASTAILTAHKAAGKIKKIIAFDPIVLPLIAKVGMSTTLGRAFSRKHFSLSKSASRRRDEFSSLENAYKRYHNRGLFKSFPDEALWDYISSGFVPYKNGVRLACRPLWEQYSYTSQGHDMHKPIAKLPKGSHIIITNFVARSTGRSIKWVKIVQTKRPDITIDHMPSFDHFFPLINPDYTINVLKSALNLGINS